MKIENPINGSVHYFNPEDVTGGEVVNESGRKTVGIYIKNQYHYFDFSEKKNLHFFNQLSQLLEDKFA